LVQLCVPAQPFAFEQFCVTGKLTLQAFQPPPGTALQVWEPMQLHVCVVVPTKQAPDGPLTVQVSYPLWPQALHGMVPVPL
jgi:hypothetical protein